MNATKTTIASFFALALLFTAWAQGAPKAAPAQLAEEESFWVKPEFEISLDLATRQQTYGLIDNEDPIATLGGVMEWHGFTLEGAAIFDFTDWGAKQGEYGDREHKYQEFAFGPGYGYTLDDSVISGLPTAIEFSMNYIYEHHPDTKKEYGEETNPDTQFLNFSVGLPDVFLSPTLSCELDIDNEVGAQYYLAEVGHTFTLIGNEEDSILDLNLSAGIGFGNAKRNRYDAEWDSVGFKDVNATASLAWHVCDNFEISPYVSVFEQLNDHCQDAARDTDSEHGDHCFVIGGISATATF